jgi:hypothetical protein
VTLDDLKLAVMRCLEVPLTRGSIASTSSCNERLQPIAIAA